MRSFIQRRKCISSKFVLCTMLMKNDGKYEKGSDLSVQNWHEKFDKFCRKHSKISKICTLIGWFWQKYIYIYFFLTKIFELTKVQRSDVWWHWRLMQTLKENWLVLPKMKWKLWQIFVHSRGRDYVVEFLQHLWVLEIRGGVSATYLNFGKCFFFYWLMS